MQNRDYNLGQLRIGNVGEKVQLVGWLENKRVVSKNLVFAVMRDFYGTTQVVLNDEKLIKAFDVINLESTIMVRGVVRERSAKNPKMPTGDIEVVGEKVTVLGKCQFNELPFTIARSREVDENLRLQYRFLDLRNPAVKDKIVLRSQVVFALRQLMVAQGFMEITTPILTSSSPEGARDYLVPSRNYPGKFYALPQAPQQFKQILMASGFDRYFQIAPCFRDEDARQDRAPGEFYQLDMEMAFADQEDVFQVIEQVMPTVFAQYGQYQQVTKAPFPRIAYADALAKYGTDKPDLRIDLTCQDVTQLLHDVPFDAWHNKNLQAVVISDFTESRKFIDNLVAAVAVESGNQPYWFKTDEQNNLVGGVAKFLADQAAAIKKALQLKPATLVVVAAGTKQAAQKTAGVVIKKAGNALPNHIDRNGYRFCWIVDFPMYEIGEESGALEFCHNPFSMPQGGLTALKAAKGNLDKALAIKAYQYDLVCNGIELSSGAVRNHNPEIMVAAFQLVGLGEADVKAKFPAMYNAFCYGAPPHAGIAPGIDRMVMLLAGEESIREVIAFPMNKKAQDVLMGAPSAVSPKQLADVHLKIDTK